MKKRILSIIVCLAMVVTTLASMPVMASATDAVDITQMTLEEQYEYVMGLESQEEIDAAREQLSEEQYAALISYAEEQVAKEAEENIIPVPNPAINYTNVAPVIAASNKAASDSMVAMSAFRMARTAVVYPVEPEIVDGTSPEGLMMNKTASANENGGYDITLETYTTGTVTKVDTTKPTDIILVLDQSGSMEENLNMNVYGKVYSVDKSKSYYIKGSNGYSKVTWCQNCSAWTTGCRWIFVHIGGRQCSPKTSENDNSENTVQFYEVKSTTTQKRMDALKNSVTGFINNVETLAKGTDAADAADDVDHRIAIVGFSSDGYNNTELLTGVEISKADVTGLKRENGTYYYPHEGDSEGEGRNGVQYGNITDAQYAAALQQINVDAGRTSITNAVDALTAHGGTYTYDGLDMASRIFEKSPADIVVDGKIVGTRNRVVILFTDGDTNSSRADTINKAYDLKNDYNATVYTVGIFDGANGEPPVVSNTSDPNKLMHYISSNYLGATAKVGIFGVTYNSGELNPNLKDGNSYYLSASDSDALNNIFQKISEEIGESNIDLGTTTVVKDIVSEYFTMPENTTDVTVKAYDCTGFDTETGEPTWAAEGTALNDAVSINAEEKSISVDGFDYSKYYVAENGRDNPDTEAKENDFYGKKLVITFNVDVREGFWGGNNVPTNGLDSGVYTEGEANPIGTFEVPTVNIPVTKPEITAIDKNIYLLGNLDESDLYNTNIPEEAWKTAYVVIDGPTLNNDIDNTADEEQKIDISVTVTPKFDGTGADAGSVAGSESATATATIRVFKPTVTYADKTVYYGDNAPNAYSPESTVWKHGDTNAGSVTMEGTAPVLEHAYQIPDGVISDGKINTKEDFHINVTTKIGTADVTEHVTFVHKDCGSDCGFDKEKGEFMLHVKTVSLTVKKTGGEAGEAYVFDIKKDNAAYTTVLVGANGTVTVKELPVGEYTVTEDENWAWRYTPEFRSGNTATLGASNPSATIICNNAKDTDTWLNFSTVVRNVFGNKNN